MSKPEKAHGPSRSSEHSSSDFITALRDFKRASAKSSNSTNDLALESESKETSDGTCISCRSHPFISLASGYWIECTEKDCPHMEQMAKFSTNMLHSFRDLGASGNISTQIPQEEIYENYFYGSKHWNYCTREKGIGPVILTIKQEFRQTRDFLRIMVRSPTHIIHGMIPVASVCSSSHGSHKEVVQFLSQEIGLTAPLQLINVSTAPADLLKIDKIFLKDEYKVGLLYVKEGQETEEEMFENQENSQAFDEFLDSLGERVQLKGFTKYKGGLDNTNDLTGTQSLHTTYKNKQIMFHVSTLLPFNKNDTQKLQRKRHIGNDIVCVVFLEAASTKFNPSCIKSNFLHTYVIVQVDVATNPNRYNVSVVSRNQVPLYEPYLVDQHCFDKGPEFRDWLLRKVINGETSCHKAPDFAKLHQRTCLLLMDELMKSLAKNEDGSKEKREPLPFRDNGWRNQTAVRPASPFEDGMQQKAHSTEELVKDFTSSFGKEKKLADVVFIAGRREKKRFISVQAIMAARSSVFNKMLLEEHSIPASKSPQDSPVIMRKTLRSVSATPSILPGGSKSRKFVLNKLRRSQSASEADMSEVVLSSITELKKTDENGIADTGESPPLREYVIKDFEADVFEALLGYLHTGSCQITAKILPGLLCAAEHYDVPELLQVCEDSIDECLDITTVYNALKSLEDYPEHSYTCAQHLRNKIGTFLQDVEMTELDITEFCVLSEESAIFMLSSAKKVSEISKFEAIVQWAKATSKIADYHATMEELAKPLLSQYVDMVAMSAEDITQVVQSSGLVPSEEILDVLASKAQSNDMDISL